MNSESRNNFYKHLIDTARIFSEPNKNQAVYKNAARYLFHNWSNIIEHLRFYTIDSKEENLIEQISYSHEGFNLGYDYIPLYQLPDSFTQQKKYLSHIEGDKLFLQIPLVMDDDLIGLMEIKTNYPMEKAIINRMIKATDIISMGLQNFLFKNDMLRKKAYTDIVIEIYNKLQSINKLDDLVLSFLKIIVSEFKFDRISAFIFDEDEKKVVYNKCICENGKEYKMDKIPELPDLTDNYLPLKNSAGYWFILKANNKKKGLILVDNIFSLYKIAERVIDIMQILCSHLATAIENIRLLSSLKEAVYYDKLTGLYNRRYFEEILPKYSKQIPISIIMGDVNGLKITNDVFGHQEGDRLLKVMADILRKACRKNDIIVRWGGDEFVILLPQTESNRAKEIIDKIKKYSSKDYGTSVKISISLGSSTKDKNEIDILDTITEAENRMYRQKLIESRDFRKSLISSLKDTLVEKCYENEGHINRMVKLSTRLGKHVGLSGNELENLRLLAMLHDIGKVAIDSSILNKKGPLNKEEWEKVKKHPEAGYRIVQTSFELSHIAYDILCHHERWDHQGYPLQKAGVDIPFLARIISVVDAYDIMTHKQPYKKALNHHQALEELRKNAGSQFDPDIVEAFCKIFEKN